MHTSIGEIRIRMFECHYNSTMISYGFRGLNMKSFDKIKQSNTFFICIVENKIVNRTRYVIVSKVSQSSSFDRQRNVIICDHGK